VCYGVESRVTTHVENVENLKLLREKSEKMCSLLSYIDLT